MIKPGDVVLARLPQADEGAKLRPALVLSMLPGRFGDLLVCGISSKLHQAVTDWDIILESDSEQFAQTGLHVSSLIRLSHIAVLPQEVVRGSLGQLDLTTLATLIHRLTHHLLQSVAKDDSQAG